MVARRPHSEWRRLQATLKAGTVACCVLRLDGDTRSHSHDLCRTHAQPISFQCLMVLGKSNTQVVCQSLRSLPITHHWHFRLVIGLNLKQRAVHMSHGGPMIRVGMPAKLYQLPHLLWPRERQVRPVQPLLHQGQCTFLVLANRPHHTHNTAVHETTITVMLQGQLEGPMQMRQGSSQEQAW
jgi:hypothetical protein